VIIYDLSRFLWITDIPIAGAVINRNPNIPRDTGFVKIICGICIIIFYAILLVQFDVSNLLDYKDTDAKDCTEKNEKDLQFLNAIWYVNQLHLHIFL
jgi:hypothetical protein